MTITGGADGDSLRDQGGQAQASVGADDFDAVKEAFAADARGTQAIAVAATGALEEGFAAELRGALAIAQVKVRDIAVTTNIRRDSLYRILNGKRAVTIVELIMYCHALGEDPFDLITRAARRAGFPEVLAPSKLG